MKQPIVCALTLAIAATLAGPTAHAAQKQKPAPLYRASDVARIRACNYDDHADLLASCDWIVEVVVERLDIKRKVFGWVAKNRRPGSIVSSNTQPSPTRH